MKTQTDNSNIVAQESLEDATWRTYPDSSRDRNIMEQGANWQKEQYKPILDAAISIMASWNKNMNAEIEQFKQSEFGSYWSPSGSMIESEAINKLRIALQELNIQ